MMAKQTRKFPGMVKIVRKTEKDAVKCKRALGGPTFEHILDADAKAISLTLRFTPEGAETWSTMRKYYTC